MSIENSARKPVPVPDASSAEFWKGAAQHKLMIQECGYCKVLAHPPAIVCRNCLNTAPDWRFTEVSGKGRISTWTIFRQSFLPGFSNDVPYVVVEVELVEQQGLKMITQLVGGADAPLRLGADVHVVFDDVQQSLSLPRFTLSH